MSPLSGEMGPAPHPPIYPMTLAWTVACAGCRKLEYQVQPAKWGWLRERTERLETTSEGPKKKWHALALRCHCGSLGFQTFPKKNRGARIGGADSWMCTDVEQCPRWKTTAWSFRSLAGRRSSLGQLWFLCLELSCRAEIHTGAWKFNVDTTKLWEQQEAAFRMFRTDLIYTSMILSLVIPDYQETWHFQTTFANICRKTVLDFLLKRILHLNSSYTEPWNSTASELCRKRKFEASVTHLE